jgi:hypothetical protein
MNRLRLTRGLAVVGTILVWIPIAAPVVFLLIRLARGGGFGMDYLMPAELFPMVVLGGVLLLVAALLARRRVKWIAWGLGLAVALLVGGQVLAVVSGLANGDTKPEGLPWVLVIASIVGYILAVIAVGVGGVLLARDLFRRNN